MFSTIKKSRKAITIAILKKSNLNSKNNATKNAENKRKAMIPPTK